MSDCFDVAIIGGGYSGSVLAIHLARQLGRGAAIALIEPRPELGAGLAYSTPEDGHKLNVPATSMGVCGQPEDRFIHWLERCHPELLSSRDPEQNYVSRRWFGLFVRERLVDTIAKMDARVDHIRAFATDAKRVGQTVEISVAKADSPVRARLLVIATSHGPPTPPRSIAPEALRATKFIADSCANDHLAKLADHDHVLIIGTGLTMADVAFSLLERGHRGKITAFSRHGLLARTNAPGAIPAGLDFAEWPAWPMSQLLHRIRDEITHTEQAGGSWHDVFTALRKQGGHLWARLPVDEKRRFSRHLKSYYDAHRYRMAPEIAARIERARADGQIEILAARLLGIDPEREGFAVRLSGRASRDVLQFAVSAIVNCTGPKQALRADPGHFLGALIARGLAHPDPLGFGLAVESDFSLVGSDRRLYALGPLTRERFGDVMGAPEIMAQAHRLAGLLADALTAAGRPPITVSG